MRKGTTIAVDLAKSVFEVAVSDRPGRVGERQRLSRAALLPFFAQRKAATVLLEACGTAHFWARELEQREVKPGGKINRHKRGKLGSELTSSSPRSASSSAASPRSSGG